ncbi:MAG: radical SAM protein [Candidatus Bathyarchaeota archaeon]|nr:radical SAM protein [Candidatus Bathyarchaeota archaeon]
MVKILPQEIWRMPADELSRLLESGTFIPKNRKIHFYAPSFMYYKTAYFSSSPNNFPTISVTGKGCALKCKHCGGKVLEAMRPATTPGEFYSTCTELRTMGAKGCLISGGCLPDGSIPLDDLLDSIKRVKKDLALTIFTHVGMIDFERAKHLKEAGIDAALIDIIGSDETIREICNLDLTVSNYDKSLKALNDAGLNFVPHVIAGLHHGKLLGEMHALQMISKYNPSAIVIIAFMPIRGTEMEKVKPPKPIDIARVIVAARLMFPDKPIALGCMRPKGEHRDETDIMAIEAGVDAIAFPSEKAIKYAEAAGYQLKFSSFCCARIYMDYNAGHFYSKRINNSC